MEVDLVRVDVGVDYGLREACLDDDAQEEAFELFVGQAPVAS